MLSAITKAGYKVELPKERLPDSELRELASSLSARSFEADFKPLSNEQYLSVFYELVKIESLGLDGELTGPKARFKAECLLSKHKAPNVRMFHEMMLALYAHPRSVRAMRNVILQLEGLPLASDSAVNRLLIKERFESVRLLLAELENFEEWEWLSVNVDNFVRHYSARKRLLRVVMLFGVAAAKRVSDYRAKNVSMLLKVVPRIPKATTEASVRIQKAVAEKLSAHFRQVPHGDALVVGVPGLMSRGAMLFSLAETVKRLMETTNGVKQSTGFNNARPFACYEGAPDHDVRLFEFLLGFLHHTRVSDHAARTADRASGHLGVRLVVFSMDSGMIPNLDRAVHNLQGVA